AKRTRQVLYRGDRKRYYDLEIRGVEAERFYEQIGFGMTRKQSARKLQSRNTNLDVVPHVARLIDATARLAILCRADHRHTYDYRIGRRRPSYAKLDALLAMFSATAGCAYRRLQELEASRFFWAEIVEIEEGETDVYDLTVPGSHSFCANGFVNHNTYL